jgi:hypothetical protein
LKLFFQLPYKALGWRAELELTKRFEIVCGRLGHDFFAGSSIRDAKDCGADFIFALHYETAKVSPLFTVALVWNPTEFLGRAGRHAWVKTMTHDAHLYASEGLRRHFAEAPAKGYRASDLGNFYPSAERTGFEPPTVFTVPTYIGALWQKGRHDELFSALNDASAINGYGPSDGWSRFKNIYRGGFAMDGRSYQTVYRRTGMGLCLHSEEHLEEGIPAMRIFEVVASGCVAICDEHSFVKEQFGDTVHYIDTKRSPREIVGEINAVVEKIRGNPGQAREMAEAAHHIFNERLSLDHLLEQSLERLVPFKANRFRTTATRATAGAVEIVTRTTGNRGGMLRRALRSLVDQTIGPVRSTLVYQGTDPEQFVAAELPRLQEEFPELKIHCIMRPPEETLGQLIASALLGSEAEFVGVLDDDDTYYPEHVQTLVEALTANPESAVAVSGAVVNWEWSLNTRQTVPVNSFARDTSELLSFEPLQSERFNKGEMNICFAMLLFRRGRIPADLGRLANVNLAEERELLSMIANRESGAMAFTSRVSCSWAYRHLQGDNVIDLRNNLEKPGLPANLAYHGLNLPYLESNRSEYSRYHSKSLAEKCAKAQKMPQKNRWIPRSIRPLAYQRKFNRLVSSILNELMSLGIMQKSDAPRIAELNALVHGPGNLLPLARQREFNRMIGEVLPSRLTDRDLSGQQHMINLTLARALERASRSF